MFTGMRTVKLACLGLLIAGSGFGYAIAQSGESTVEVVKVESVAPAEEADALSPKEQAKQAEAAVERASASCSAQAKALETAQREKDIIRATCLDDKLAQCTANLQNMKRRQAALNQAIEADDAGSRNHEFAVIGVLSQKFKMLEQAANQCVGQDLFETGDTKVRQEVDPYAPDENPAIVPPVPEPPIPYIPPPVSGVT